MTESVRVWSRLCFKGSRGAADNQHRRRGTPQAYSCEPHVVHGLPMGICKVIGLFPRARVGQFQNSCCSSAVLHEFLCE